MAAGMRCSLAPSQGAFDVEATCSRDREGGSRRFALKRLKPPLGTRVYALVALASMLMTQSQDGRRHSGDQAHHPETPEPRTLSVQVTRNRSVNHPSVDSKDLPLDAINAETDALLSEQGPPEFRKP
jgi:hypothetical protein|tara:strand:+ start:470 stop:850 length:381 start_codon:yes stop_codon:yes gene_type:complete